MTVTMFWSSSTFRLDWRVDDVKLCLTTIYDQRLSIKNVQAEIIFQLLSRSFRKLFVVFFPLQVQLKLQLKILTPLSRSKHSLLCFKRVCLDFRRIIAFTASSSMLMRICSVRSSSLLWLCKKKNQFVIYVDEKKYSGNLRIAFSNSLSPILCRHHAAKYFLIVVIELFSLMK